MNRLSRDKRIAVLSALVEGCSINATARMTGVGKPTILRLLLNIGRVCMEQHDATVRGLYCRHIEADEVWGFCHCKDRAVPGSTADADVKGSVWTWYAFATDTKLILSWVMGDRDADHAYALMDDLASRLIGRPQITTDALRLYESAVFDAFARLGVDYATIHKDYGKDPSEEHRYSPPQCLSCTKKPVFGSPRMERASTSGIERANLTLRMSQRRWTRLTNAHSKSFNHMISAFALHVTYYNFARPHASLGGKTPAQAAKLADRAWKMEDIVALLEADENRAD